MPGKKPRFQPPRKKTAEPLPGGAVDNSANKDDVVKKTTTGGDIQFNAIKSVNFDNCILSQPITCKP